MDLHDDILRENGGSWREPPLEVSWTSEHRARRDALLSEYAGFDTWGFKDPRTLLTLQGWRETLPRIRTVGTFRHPAAVAASLAARDGLAFEEGLNLWKIYNERLLRYRNELGGELVSFDLPPEEYRASVARIARSLGLRPPTGGFRFFDTEMRHHRADEGSPLPQDVCELYQRLLAASGISQPVMLETKPPALSVVVVVHNMAREAPRTLASLSPEYQKGIEAECYEVIVVDNGSSVPLGEKLVWSIGENFDYVYVEDAVPSPAAAVNLGAGRARGEHVGILVDGARMVTPGMLAAALECLGGFSRAVVGSIGFHLGPGLQMHAARYGYSQALEDELLESIGWPGEGYRLFEIAALAASSELGWFGPMNESNCLFMPRALFRELGGYDEAFDLPGGGFVNLDFWVRACEATDTNVFTLAGEASFHQFHFGASTGLTESAHAKKLDEWNRQFEHIRGRPFHPPGKTPRLFGGVPPEALPWIQRSAAGVTAGEKPHELQSKLDAVLSSRSWRLTAPLRRLAHFWRGK